MMQPKRYMELLHQNSVDVSAPKSLIINPIDLPDKMRSKQKLITAQYRSCCIAFMNYIKYHRTINLYFVMFNTN